MTREEREACVDWFCERMKAKLASREHKGNWRDETIMEHLASLRGELRELEDAIHVFCLEDSVENQRKAVLEAVDAANYAMIVAELLARYPSGDKSACQLDEV